MATYTSPLDRVRVAAPCPAGWERMRGDAQVRFCDQCNLNVYNLSGMSRREAEALITRNEGRLCVRFYRRADGTILTDNCPVGLRALRRRVSRIANATISAIVGFFSGFGINMMFTGSDDGSLHRQYQIMGAIAAIEQPLAPQPIKEPGPVEYKGKLAPTPPPSDEGWVEGKMSVENHKVRRGHGRK